MKKKVAISVDENIMAQVDKQAKKLRLNRSQMVQNCLEVALMDLKILKFLGIFDMVRVVMDYQEKVGTKKADIQAALS